jgi:hypothetical protein
MARFKRATCKPLKKMARLKRAMTVLELRILHSSSSSSLLSAFMPSTQSLVLEVPIARAR